MICPSCGSENLEGNDRCENCLASFRDLDIPGSDKAEGLALHAMEDKLSALDQETPIIVTPQMPAIDVARRMKEANSGCALVLDGPKLVGIFTEHDVLNRLCAVLGTPASTKSSGAESREGGARPTSSEDVPFIDAPFGDIPVEEIRADEMMVEEEDTGGDNSLDTGRRFASALQVPVKDLMSHNPETLHEHESIAFALNKMSIGRYRHIPVNKADGSYTVASIKSVLRYIAQRDW